MLTELRRQVQEVLYAIPAKRKPALRRSDEPDALFATDLPLTTGPDAMGDFSTAMADKGWRVCERRGWLVLDADVPVPEYVMPSAPAGECGCCIALLLRHPDDAPAAEWIRAVTKAAEAGVQPFERLCSQLHGELAERLRLHHALPGGLLPYLCRGYEMYYK